MPNLDRFIEAHERMYRIALAEIENGIKVSHWMWYIFPQLHGLGKSAESNYYAIHDFYEAREYLEDPYLGGNLIEISEALLHLEVADIRDVLEKPDDMKLRSCMTLFHIVDPDNPVFKDVLDRYFQGNEDRRTLALLGMV